MASARFTVDKRSSPPADWAPHGLITSKILCLTYNAAMKRLRRTGKEIDPLEWESTNLWEDIYHHNLLKGYCNNSQIPPHDISRKRCDIVTRYFDHRGQRQTLVFTEVKRANIAEATEDIQDTEAQVRGYCTQYFKARDSNDYVFACTAIGPYIRCFRAEPSAQAGGEIEMVDIRDYLRGITTDLKQSSLVNYMDAYDDQHAVSIRTCFAEIRRNHPPPFPPPSRPSSSSSQPGLAGSPMSGLSGPAAGSQRSSPPAQRGNESRSGRNSSSGPGPRAVPQTPQQNSPARSTADSPQRGRRAADAESRRSDPSPTPSQGLPHRQQRPSSSAPKPQQA